MDTEIRVDTNRLRDHAFIVSEQRRLADSLCHHLTKIRNLAPPDQHERVMRLCQKAMNLEHHFSVKASMVEDLSIFFERCSRELGTMLQDSADSVSGH